MLASAARSGAQALCQPGRLGSLATGKDADLLVIRKDRLFYPPGKYARTPPLDVLIDRANAADIDQVMVAGQVLLDDGVITTVDEDLVRARYEEAGRDRFWAATDAADRRRQLAAAVDPYVFAFYRGWDQVPVDPAYEYNMRRPRPE